MQEQFQRLLDNRIYQLQEDATQQIQNVKTQERQMQALLEEKMRQIEQEYISVSLHETKIQEKQNIIDSLKSELNSRQNEVRDELHQKMKSLEDRLKREAEIAEVNARNTIANLENKISASSSENARLTAELGREVEKNKTYVNAIREYETQRKKLSDTIEEMTSNNNQLKRNYEEEVNNVKQLENDNQTLKKSIQAIRSAVEALKQEKDNQSEILEAVNKETEALKAEINAETKRSRALAREIEELKNESKNAETHSNGVIKELKEQVAELNRDNKQLNERIIAVMQTANEKFEKEAKAHYDAKNSLQLAENTLLQKDNEIKSLLTQLENQKLALEHAEYTLGNLREDMRIREREIKDLLQEKQDLLQKSEQLKIRACNLKNQVKALVQTGLKAVRRDLEEVRKYSKTSISELVKETLFKVEHLAATSREIIWKQQAKFVDEINNLKAKLVSDCDLKLQEQGEEFERARKKAVDTLEKRLFSLEREHETLKIDYEATSKRLADAEQELERSTNDVYRLERELSEASTNNTHLLREKEASDLKYEQAKHRHNSELQQLNREFERLKEESAQSRKELEAKQDAEIKELQDALEHATKKHERAIFKYEEQLKSLEAVHEKEIIASHKELTEKINNLTETNQSLEVVIQELIQKLKALQDNVDELEQNLTAKEQQSQELQADYEARIEELRYQLEEQKLHAGLEADNLQRMKREKAREIEGLQQQVKRLQEEVTQKAEKVNSLQQEKTRLEDNVRDLQRQLELRVSEADKQKRELFERQRSQAKEIEQLQGLLSKSYMSAGGPRELRLKDENEERIPEMELSKSVKGLKTLDKYLEASRSPKKFEVRSPGTFGKIEETPKRQDDVGQFRSVKPLSISQLKP